MRKSRSRESYIYHLNKKKASAIRVLKQVYKPAIVAEFERIEKEIEIQQCYIQAGYLYL